MSTNVASPKSTGGGGFIFEDKVCAWFLSHMLADESPFDSGTGILTRIDFQTRPDGWLLDDILLTLQTGDTQRRCSLSIKSNNQFIGNKAPSDFLRSVWEQYLDETALFNKISDFMGLVTVELISNVRGALDFVVMTAKEGDTQLLPQRYAQKGWANKIKKTLFESFSCPHDLAQKHGLSSENTGKLLSRLIFKQFDFESASSESEKQAIERCRRALQSGSIDEGVKLWNSLIQISTRKRPNAGYITRLTLLDELRHAYNLADLPNHCLDWNRLLNLASISKDKITDLIGGKVHIDRKQDIQNLSDALSTSIGAILLGPSGIGKSAIAKIYANQILAEGHKCLWFDCRSFERKDFADFQTSLQLSHSLTELFRSISDATAVIILDGLDCLYDNNAFSLVMSFLNILELERQGSPWRIILTCQTHEWLRLQNKLVQAISIPKWCIVNCNAVSLDALESVWQKFPQMARLQFQKKLEPLFANLKILDLITTNLVTVGNVQTSAWIGESSIANWFWKSIIASGNECRLRERFTIAIAEKQADELKSSISCTDFEISELTPLNGLEQDKIFYIDDQKIYFQHDLIGDWARLQVLIAKSDNLIQYLRGRIDSPLWHRAVMLYGMHVLESVADVEKWRILLDDLSKNIDEGTGDFLLDSIIFAADPLPILIKVYPDLMQNNGKLLHRLICRFLTFATLPDQRILDFAQKEGIEEGNTGIIIRYRLPIWQCWPPILRFLHKHRAEVMPGASMKIADLLAIWLNYTPKNFMLRCEAAELAFILGKDAHDSYKNNGYIGLELRKLFYKVALSGADELPDEIELLALKASGRLVEEENGKRFETDHVNSKCDLECDSNKPLEESWPDGPLIKTDDAFQEIVLETNVLTQLIRTRPAIAREVILASIIKIRTSNSYSRHWNEDTELDLNDDHQWNPPLYIYGPFLNFLNENFEEGLKTITRLVNFASERWHFFTKKNNNIPPGRVILAIDEKSFEFIGDARTYGWSAGFGNPPSVVTVALMALEMYFYQEIQNGRSVEDKIKLVFEHSRSISFLKVLCDVGRMNTKLFEGPLLPLLTVPDIFEWETLIVGRGRQHLMMGLLLNSSPSYVKLVKEFNEMKHRSINILKFALDLFLNNQTVQDYISNARIRWEKLIGVEKNTSFKEFIQNLIICFDIKNYQILNHPEHGPIRINIKALEVYNKQTEERKASEEQLSVLLLPIQCQKMLQKNEPLPENQIEQFWSQVQQIAKYEHQNNMLNNEYLNAITGAAAVFICLHYDWLVKHPENMQWCINQFRMVVQNPPLPDNIDCPEALISCCWDYFAAEAIPVLWSKKPDNKEVRDLIVRLVFTYHYSAVKILFQQCAKFRSLFGADFDRLRRLLFELSFMRSRASFVQQSRYYSESLDDKEIQKFNKVVENWSEERIAAFVDGTIPMPTNSWNDMDMPKNFIVIDKLRKKYRNNYFLDFRLIRYAHEWLPEIDQAQDIKERQTCLNFLHNCLTYALSHVSMDEEHEDRPEEDEYWILERIAINLPFMTLDERPENLWKPILSLPNNASRWAEIFLSRFHCYGLVNLPTSSQFISLRKTIIEYVLYKDQKQKNYQWRYFKDFWLALIGIDFYNKARWEPRHNELAKQIFPFLDQWLLHIKGHYGHIAAFAAWLEIEAASSVRIQGLVWLDRALITDNGDPVYYQDKIENSIASLLHVIWNKNESAIRQNINAFSAFKRLLHWLVGKQNAFALELERIIGQF